MKSLLVILLFLVDWALMAASPMNPLYYRTNDYSFSPTNALGSNILAGTNITIRRAGAYGQLTIDGPATGVYASNIISGGVLTSTNLVVNGVQSNDFSGVSGQVFSIGSNGVARVSLSNDVLKISVPTLVSNDLGSVTIRGGNIFQGTENGNVAYGNGAGTNFTTTGALGQHNVAFGETALSLNSTGVANSAFGFWALKSNVFGTANTAIGDATLMSCITNNNTAVGMEALMDNVSGQNNVAVGMQASVHQTTNEGNTAVGGSALHSVVSDYNTGIGFCALNKTTTGSNNTTLGAYSLYNNTLGYENIAVGRSALINNLTGIRNVGVGLGALYSTTDGGYNLGVGNYSLSGNFSGSQNNALGYGALQSSTGDGNTGLGYKVLNAATSQNGNTAIGWGAGYGSAAGNSYNSLSDSYCTFVGYLASRADTTTNTIQLTNATAIGYRATVATNNALVLGGTGDYAVNIGIGTNNPQARLHIDVAGASGNQIWIGSNGVARVSLSNEVLRVNLESNTGLQVLIMTSGVPVVTIYGGNQTNAGHLHAFGNIRSAGIVSGAYFVSGGWVSAAANSGFLLGANAALLSSAVGVIKLGDYAGTNFGRLQFGGTSTNYPSIINETATNATAGGATNMIGIGDATGSAGPAGAGVNLHAMAVNYQPFDLDGPTNTVIFSQGTNIYFSDGATFNAGVGAFRQFNVQTGGVDVLTVSNGCLGIGKANPASRLDINGGLSTTATIASGAHLSMAAGSYLYWLNRSAFTSPSDMVLALTGCYATNFNLLVFGTNGTGGNAKFFPAIKKTSFDPTGATANFLTLTDATDGTNGCGLELKAIPNNLTNVNPSADCARIFAVTNGAGSAELFVQDEAGNQTLISPHASADVAAWFIDDWDDYPSVAKEINWYLGKIRWHNKSREATLKQWEWAGTNITLLPVLKRTFHYVEDFAAYNKRLSLTNGNGLARWDWGSIQTNQFLSSIAARSNYVTAWVAETNRLWTNFFTERSNYVVGWIVGTNQQWRAYTNYVERYPVYSNAVWLAILAYPENYMVLTNQMALGGDTNFPPYSPPVIAAYNPPSIEPAVFDPPPVASVVTNIPPFELPRVYVPKRIPDWLASRGVK